MTRRAGWLLVHCERSGWSQIRTDNWVNRTVSSLSSRNKILLTKGFQLICCISLWGFSKPEETSQLRKVSHSRNINRHSKLLVSQSEANLFLAKYQWKLPHGCAGLSRTKCITFLSNYSLGRQWGRKLGSNGGAGEVGGGGYTGSHSKWTSLNKLSGWLQNILKVKYNSSKLLTWAGHFQIFSLFIYSPNFI